jgi:hypothetical protein
MSRDGILGSSSHADAIALVYIDVQLRSEGVCFLLFSNKPTIVPHGGTLGKKPNIPKKITKDHMGEEDKND